MNHLKIITFLEVLVKISIAISLLFIVTGVVVHILDIYNILRNSFFIGIPLFLISLICYLSLGMFRNFKLKKPIIKLLMSLIILCLITTGLYILFGKIMEAVSH